MTCVRRCYDVQKIKMAAVRKLKFNNNILETRISFLHSDNRKNYYNVYDSYVIGYDVIAYICDEKHHLSKWLGKEKK